jgi:hypothetical protein
MMPTAPMGHQPYVSLLGQPALAGAATVTTRRDDAPAADQAAITNAAGVMPLSGSDGLIQTTSG